MAAFARAVDAGHVDDLERVCRELHAREGKILESWPAVLTPLGCRYNGGPLGMIDEPIISSDESGLIATLQDEALCGSLNC